MKEEIIKGLAVDGDLAKLLAGEPIERPESFESDSDYVEHLMGEHKAKMKELYRELLKDDFNKVRTETYAAANNAAKGKIKAYLSEDHQDILELDLKDAIEKFAELKSTESQSLQEKIKEYKQLAENKGKSTKEIEEKYKEELNDYKGKIAELSNAIAKIKQDHVEEIERIAAEKEEDKNRYIYRDLLNKTLMKCKDDLTLHPKFIMRDVEAALADHDRVLKVEDGKLVVRSKDGSKCLSFDQNKVIDDPVEAILEVARKDGFYKTSHTANNGSHGASVDVSGQQIHLSEYPWG